MQLKVGRWRGQIESAGRQGHGAAAEEEGGMRGLGADEEEGGRGWVGQ